MKKFLNFLIKANKLKEMPRTGWVLMDVKNPETVAEHTFRIIILSWLLGKKKKLDIKKLIKFSLIHDLCEVYAGDVTPFFYYTSLPKNKEKRKAFLGKWVRLSKKEKEKKGKRKFEKEKKGLLKLVKFLSPPLRKEIFSCWLNYEKSFSKEGKFVKQTDRIETLIQSIEYFGTKEEDSGSCWWEGTKELVDDPLLIDFLDVIEKKFYKKRIKTSVELDGVLDFVLKIGKLKKMPRTGWELRGVKTPETMGGHIFTIILMVWLLSNKFSTGLDQEKLLKMALVYEICEVYAGDKTPYDKILKGKTNKEKKEILKKWIRLSKKEKSEAYLKDYQEEKLAIQKLTTQLGSSLKKEIIQLWEEFKTANSPEGRFINEVDVLSILLQACLYWQKDKNFPIDPFWEGAFESCESQISFEFMEELKKNFYKKKFSFENIFKKLKNRFSFFKK